jgi:hypothetical protein
VSGSSGALGVIDLDKDFGEAGDAPPLHPRWMCVLDLFALDARKHASEGMLTHKRMTPMDTTAPVVKIAKAFADSGRSFMTESELTEKIFEYAQLDRRDGETEAQCFSRVFGANTPESLLFRKAVAVCNGRTLAVSVGRDDNDAAQAYRKLERLAERERTRTPGLTPEQAFTKVFSDPANRQLADLAHQPPGAVLDGRFERLPCWRGHVCGGLLHAARHMERPHLCGAVHSMIPKPHATSRRCRAPNNTDSGRKARNLRARTFSLRAVDLLAVGGGLARCT